MRARRDMPAALAALVLLLAAACQRAGEEGAAPPPEPVPEIRCDDCNVLLISIDTLRADHLGCAGYERDTSPAIDAFSRDSIVFRQAISHGPSTTISHAALFTSHLPERHGASRPRGAAIAADVPTLAEMLRAAGFRTTSFNSGGQVSADYGFGRGFDQYDSTRHDARFDLAVNKAVRWLDANGDQRFFLFLHTYEVHAPYTPAAEDLARFPTDYAGPLPDQASMRMLLEVRRGQRTLTEADVGQIRRAYDCEISSVDRAFARLMKHLRESGLHDDTLILFTSDHGEEFGEHGRVADHSLALYDELLRVPLILKLPGSALAGTVVEPQVRHVDVVPTLLDVLGLPVPDGLDGTSLVPLLRGEREGTGVAISQQDTLAAVAPTSVRTETAKLITRASMLQGAPFRWYRREATLPWPSEHLVLHLASFDEDREVEILVDGVRKEKLTLGTERQEVELLQRPGPKTVIVRSLTPCSRTGERRGQVGLHCAAFRLFQPDEFYLLADDPGETRNLILEPAHREEIARLRAALQATRARGTSDGQPADVDEATLEQLRALGYIH